MIRSALIYSAVDLALDRGPTDQPYRSDRRTRLMHEFSILQEKVHPHTSEVLVSIRNTEKRNSYNDIDFFTIPRLYLTFANISVQCDCSPCPGWQNLLPRKSFMELMSASLSTTATISYSKGAAICNGCNRGTFQVSRQDKHLQLWNLISLVIKICNKNDTLEHKKQLKKKKNSFTSTPAHLAATKSSDEKTPKWADPLWIRRRQSKRSIPITHSTLDVCSRIGQNLVAFLYVPRPSTMHTRTKIIYSLVITIFFRITFCLMKFSVCVLLALSIRTLTLRVVKNR